MGSSYITDGQIIEAHGIGGAADLPIPASFAIAGGAAALVLSFSILMVAWRRPRFEAPTDARLAPQWARLVADSPLTLSICRAVGMLALAFWVFAALAGPDKTINPVFGMLYAWLWTGIVPFSILLGPYIRMFSPARTAQAAAKRLMREPTNLGLITYPQWLGRWPAALGLFSFVWIELVYPDGTFLGPVRLWVALYFALMFVGALIFGDEWFENADPFEVYSNLVAHLSPWGRNQQHRLVLRSPLRNLATLSAGPGLVAVVAVLLGSTAFDSFRGSVTWVRFVQENDLGSTWVSTSMLLAMCLLSGGVLTFGAVASALLGDVRQGRELPARLAHSLVPIIVGYMVAHYLTFFVETGQDTLIKASDPLAHGMNLFGTAGWQVNYWISQHPTGLATTKVVAIVSGHVLGVVAAHDRSLSLLRTRRFAMSQLPLLVSMTAFTWGGLFLLFGA